VWCLQADANYFMSRVDSRGEAALEIQRRLLDSSIEIYERLNQSFFTTQKNVLVASKDFQRSLCTVVLIPT
jgi:hypothetical protein